MELSKYIGKYVKADLKNGFYYKGIVKFADDNSISITDKNGLDVDISVDQISFIREVSE